MSDFTYFKTGLERKASTKTFRYFIKSSDYSFDAYSEKVWNTFCVVRGKKRTHDKIDVNGVSYECGEYKFTPNMNKLIQHARLWVSQDALIKTEYCNCDKSEAGVELLTPEEIEAFFRTFNESQSTEETIVTEPVVIGEEKKCLSDMKYLWTEQGLVSWAPKADDKDCEYIAFLNKPKCPITDMKYLRVYTDTLPEAEVGAWLLN